MERKDIVCGVLDAVEQFIGRKLWKRFTNFDFFGVRVVGRDELLLAGVLGDAGEEYGLSLFRGSQAAAFIASLLDSDGPGDDVLNDMDMLSFSIEAFGDLPPDAQAVLREAGRHPRYDEEVPHFLAKPPRQQPRVPNDSELSLLLLVLRGVVEADRKKLLEPAELDDEDGICVLSIGGDPSAPRVSVTRERVMQQQRPRTVPLVAEKIDVRGLPRLDATWLVGMPAVPMSIQGDDRITQMVLVVDEASEYVFQAKPVLGSDLREAVKIVVDVLHCSGRRSQEGVPRKIRFSSRKLHDALTPMLAPAGVECIYEPEIPALQAIVADLVAYLDRDSSLLAEEDRETQASGKATIPAPNDLKGWKQADQRLFQRFIQDFGADPRLRSPRAVKRYFNDDDLDYYLQEHEQQGVMPAYMAWAILDYRPTKTSKTHAEKMMAEGLPQPQATLLKARVEACPTLYRVAGHDAKAGTVQLEDVLLGGSVTAHDQLMSENIEDNLFFAARAFPAGNFHFIELAGPPLGAGMGLEAVEYLRHSKMKFTPEGLRQDAHKFGWLWQWMDQWQTTRKPMELRNTDGEKFLWHIASFSVADSGETRRTLRQREDIDYDKQADELVWSKPAGPDNRVMGDTVTLGRIEFVGDELVVTVNSAERFKAARRWLEELPGVVFKSVRTRRWDEAEKDRPLDERISPPEPVELTPEMAASIQEKLNEHYMGWLDEPLPILGGKTPRQACRTEAGRQQVTMLIRTMPDPMGSAPIRAPREAMLRELGLATESPASPQADRHPPHAPIPIEDVPAKPRVPRNAPCPCGSGRKYKKCCGRES
jgi:hypothetical protein